MYTILNLLVFCIPAGAINFYCQKDEVQIGLENYLLAELDNNNKCLIKDDQNPLELIQSIPLTNIQENVKLIYSSSDKANDLKLIFQDKDQFLFLSNEISLNIFEKSDVELILNRKKKFNFQLSECDNILKEYFIVAAFMLFCENVNSYKIYQFQEKLNEQNQLEFIFDKNYELNKQIDCKIDISQDLNQIIYFSYLECQTWKIYMIQIDSISLIYDSKIINNHEILRDILIKKKNSLIFDHKIFQFEQTELYLKLIYENQQEKILTYENIHGIDYIVIESQTVNVLEEADGYIIKRSQKPIQIIESREKPIINFGSYLELLRENKQKSFILNIPSGILLNKFQFSPYFILLSKEKLTILKQNLPYLQLKCNQFKNQEVFNLTPFNIAFENYCLSGIVKQIDLNEIDLLNFSNIELEKRIHNLNFLIELDQQKFLKHGLIPNLSIYSNNFIFCKHNQNFLEVDCINSSIMKSIWWIMKEGLNEKIFIYQINDQLIEILECSSNRITKIIVKEVIQQKNIFNFQRYVFLIQNQNTKILRIDTENLKNMKLILDLKTQVINILSINIYQVLIILENCHNYILQLETFVQQKQFKIDSHGQCIQPKSITTLSTYLNIANKNIISLHKINFMISFKLDGEEILDLVEIRNNNYIILLEQDKEFIFRKYKLTTNYEFIKLFDFPLLFFKLYLPLKYEVKYYKLVVAAISKNDSTQVLLVYHLENEQYNSLIDVIKVDNFQFSLISEFKLLIFQNQKYLLYNLAKISLNCSLTSFFEYEISQPLIVKLHSKINPEKAINSSINIKLFNQIESLQIKNLTFIKTTTDNPNILISIDPRKYIQGSLVNITSQDIVIMQPLLQSQPTFFKQCDHFYNTVCFNQKENYIILNIFSNNQKKIFVNEQIKNIFKSNNFYFLYQTNFISIFNKDSNLIQQINLKDNYFIEILEIIMIDNIVIFQSQQKLVIYLMKPLYFQLIDEINVYQCQSYKFVKIQNKQDCFLIYYTQPIEQNSTYWVINIEEGQEVLQKKKLMLDLVQDISISLKEIEIIYIRLINDSYYEFKYLIIPYDILTAYVMSCQIEKDFQQILKLQKLGIVRFPNLKSIFYEIIILTDDQFLFTKQDLNSQLSLSIFNISEINKFNLIDSIFNIQLNAKFEYQGIQIYNQTHFFYVQLNHQYELCSINPYQLNISNISTQPIIINFQNNVSNVSLQLFIQNSVNNQSNVKFQLYWILGLILLLMLLCLFYFQVRGKYEKKVIANLEIEL
ncbi:unnamed protein product [Paramecium sonneborni]|uniref:Transmembrane protein n=1 Tax=Paramecium sonneborni TaxID=65129 RepID=A0A8S1QUB1_9CILI|nr:unnamed protein product [Paramecium sonneborni]